MDEMRQTADNPTVEDALTDRQDKTQARLDQASEHGYTETHILKE